MNFSISKRENIRENINRILFEQIDYILKHCESERKDIHNSIHEIRKSIKRIRAVLRLIREEIGYSSYCRENVFYRDINRITSELRTYNVLVITLEKLRSDLSDKIPSEAMESLIGSIRQKMEKLLFEIQSNKAVLKDMSTVFREARMKIPDLTIEHNGFEAFSGGMFRMYRQGKKFLLSAEKKSDMHHLHDMRKRMKYLWYQVEILTPIYPDSMKAYANSLENISNKLGIYHDLAVLEEYLQKNEAALEKQLQLTLLDACDFKKAALLPGIMRMAGTVYIEEPEVFVNRIGGYWKIFYQQT